MRQTAKAHDTEMRDNTKLQEANIKTDTQVEIEKMKAQLALILARMNKTAAKEAEAEAVERGI
jgi:uncharacterized coiled-coil protein SlyX